MKPFLSHRLLVATASLLGALAATGCTKVQLNNPFKARPNVSTVELNVLAVTPPNGPTAGGTLLSISGEGFVQGMSVKVGGTNCQNVTIVSANLLTCTTLAHISGLVDVQVTPPSGAAILLTRAFTYLASIPTLPGFAATAGGGISSGGGIIVRAAVGEAGTPAILSGGSVNLISGVHGVHYGP